jgi:hypothetical protein
MPGEWSGALLASIALRRKVQANELVAGGKVNIPYE